MAGWRYIASRLNGDGTESFLDFNLPLRDVKLKDVLSGPAAISATISPEIPRIMDDGLPLFEPWSTAIYAELGGEIQGAGILTDMQVEGESLTLECTGWAGYPKDMPYTGDWSQVNVDPLDVVREAWRHLQSQPGGNIGLTLDGDATKVRLGDPKVPGYTEVQIGGKWVRSTSVPASAIDPEATSTLTSAMTATSTSFTVKDIGKYAQISTPFEVTISGEKMTVGSRSGTTFSSVTRGIKGTTKRTHGKGAYVKHAATPTRKIAEIPAKPVRLAWYQTHDLDKEIVDLAVATPFDYREVHYWSGEQVAHRLQFGVPVLGRRRDDLRFVLGENVFVQPKIEFDGSGYASDVVMLGAGEGSKMIRSHLARRDHRLRRVAVVADKALRSTAATTAAARAELAWRLGSEDVTEIVVSNHPNAPLGSCQVGDEIYVQVGSGWSADTALWVRVLSIQVSPDQGDASVLSIARVDRIS